MSSVFNLYQPMKTSVMYDNHYQSTHEQHLQTTFEVKLFSYMKGVL